MTKDLYLHIGSVLVLSNTKFDCTVDGLIILWELTGICQKLVALCFKTDRGLASAVGGLYAMSVGVAGRLPAVV